MTPYRFSQHSLMQYQALHGDLQKIIDIAIKHHDFRIQEGYRDKAAQDTYFARGTTKVRWPNSRHNSNPSMAMDLWPFVNGKFIGWNDTKQWYYFGGMVVFIGRQLKDSGEIGHTIRWGGDWDRDNDLSDQRFNDLPHFELLEPSHDS